MIPPEPNTDIPATPPIPQSDALLSGKQRRLLEALTAKHQLAANLYYSALVTLAHHENPCRSYLAAHAIREMVDKLPQFLEIPQPEKPPNIKVEINNLKAAWDNCPSSKQANWDGIVGAPERRFFKKAKKFFDWYAAEHIIRYERNVAMVRNFDPSSHKLPTPLEDMRVKEWRMYSDYFTGIAHLGDPSELADWLSQFEQFLLNTLVPRTFEDYNAIDDILKEGSQ